MNLIDALLSKISTTYDFYSQNTIKQHRRLISNKTFFNLMKLRRKVILDPSLLFYSNINPALQKLTISPPL